MQDSAGRPEEAMKPGQQARGERGDAEGPDRPAEKPAANTVDRPGLPDPETVISVTEFTSPKGRRYRILRTTEKDEYDPPDPPVSPPPRRGRGRQEERE